MPANARAGRPVQKRLVRVLGVVLLAAVVYLFRPLFHSLAMLAVVHPALLEGLLVWGILHFAWWRRVEWLNRPRTGTYVNEAGKKGTFQYRWLWWVSGSAAVVILGGFMVVGNWLSQVSLSQELQYTAIDHLPESAANVRLLPQEVATRYARDSLQLSQYRLGRPSLTMVEGDLHWTYPLVPQGIVLKFLRPAAGVMTVRATTQDKATRLIESPLVVAEGQLLFDNLWWRVYLVRYWVTGEKPFYKVVDDKVWTIVPAIGYRLRFRWGILHTVPYFAGVFTVSPAGTVRFVSVSEVAADEIAGGERVFPETLARRYVEAFAYRRGLINRLFLHVEQSEIQDVPESNRQPFLMNTDEGLVWFTSTEPYGRSHGIFKIFLVSATTGRLSVYTPSSGETLTGPVGALDYVRKANPLVDWNRFRLVEPLPFIRHGVLFWKTPIIPEDGAGVAFQAFVNSRNNQVFTFTSDEEIKAFLAETVAPSRSDRTPSSAPETHSPDVESLLRELRLRLQEAEAILKQLEAQTRDQVESEPRR
ncbi:MAG: hypothetical protein IMX00_05950 [Limnochordales bacterium]|nr:hypothetical protein [Limnochordales bacterium]